VVHDEHLLLADTPDTFAEQVVRLLTDDALCDRLACNARRLVEARYDSRATGRRFEQLARRIAGGGTGGALRECNT
jgi:glycosyltransferase involved in cell wall biosynthesis